MISLLVLLVLVGVALYFVGMLPIDPGVMKVIRALAILFVVVAVLAWLFPGYMPAQLRHW